MNKQKIFISFILVFCLLISSHIYAADLNKENLFEDNEDLGYSISGAGVKYDNGIENKFFYKDRVYVSVTIRDNSGIVYNGTKEERHEQWEIQNEWYKNEINKITDTLNEDEFTLYRKNPVSFSGFITNKGFEKLKNMEDIEAIELPGGGQGQSFFFLFHLKWFVYLFFLLILIIIILIIIKSRKKRRNVKKR